MTDEKRDPEGSEEAIEDLEAPAGAQEDVAGGMGLCRPTNRCAPVNTVVHCPSPSQLCAPPTCQVTSVMVQ
jgi:hypothetical protein